MPGGAGRRLSTQYACAAVIAALTLTFTTECSQEHSGGEPAAQAGGATGNGGASDSASAQPDFTCVWTWNLSEGENPVRALRAQWQDLLFTDAVRPRIEEYRKTARLSLENPGSVCLHFGMPQAMLFSGGYPMEIIQRQEQVTVIFEAYSEIRRIFMEPHPYEAEDEWPSLIGFSSGHWEGDTLVVRTLRLKEQLSGNIPHSENGRIEERYRLEILADDTPVIVNDWMLTDPDFYSEPVARSREWKPLGNRG